MYDVDFYGRVRLAVLGHRLSQREAARRFGIDCGTVRKMPGHSVAPGYRREEERHHPKLAAHIGFIDQILADDLDARKSSVIRSNGFTTGCARSVGSMAATRRCGITSIRAG